MDPWSPAEPDPEGLSSESLLALKFWASQTFSFETLVISPGIVGICGQRHASSDRDMRSEPAPLWLTRPVVAASFRAFECDQGVWICNGSAYAVRFGASENSGRGFSKFEIAALELRHWEAGRKCCGVDARDGYPGGLL